MVGVTWARLRTEVMRMIELKLYEMQHSQSLPRKRQYGAGKPDSRVPQAD
jgi:hypothetical protein